MADGTVNSAEKQIQIYHKGKESQKGEAGEKREERISVGGDYIY
jgi:hypothetical protein